MVQIGILRARDEEGPPIQPDIRLGSSDHRLKLTQYLFPVLLRPCHRLFLAPAFRPCH